MRSDGPALMPVFRSQYQAELLMWLMLHPEQEYGVTELAARLGVPLSTLHREVNRLDLAGLLASRTQGRNRLIRANVEHPAAKPLAQLLEITFGPRAVVAEEFVEVVAGRSESDLRRSHDLNAPANPLSRRYGNRVSGVPSPPLRVERH